MGTVGSLYNFLGQGYGHEFHSLRRGSWDNFKIPLPEIQEHPLLLSLISAVSFVVVHAQRAG